MTKRIIGTGSSDPRRTNVPVPLTWSGPLSIQDIETPSPENKPFRLINLPFYYAGQLDKVIEKYGTL